MYQGKRNSLTELIIYQTKEWLKEKYYSHFVVYVPFMCMKCCSMLFICCTSIHFAVGCSRMNTGIQPWRHHTT